MMYLVREKKSKEIIFENSDPLPNGLKGIEIYPGFDSKTMELLTYSGDELPQHYKVSKKGVIVEKTLNEKIKGGLIEFSTDLFQHAEFDGDSSDLPSMQLIKTGLKLKLIKTIEHCELAFQLLDDEFEQRVSEQFRPGHELKIMKDYTDWIGEGKPVDDKREQKYLAMKETIAAIKDDYIDVRAALKKIIIPLKDQASE